MDRIPRSTGDALHSRALVCAQVWAANAGLALMAIGFGLVDNAVRAGTPVLATGGLLSAASAYAFAYNLWRTIDGVRAADVLTTPSSSRSGPRR